MASHSLARLCAVAWDRFGNLAQSTEVLVSDTVDRVGVYVVANRPGLRQELSDGARPPLVE